MPKEINPKDTKRAAAYELWMKAPNPMVTFFKTLDVTNLLRISKKRKMKFNMLLDYCIGKSAAGVKEFYLLPVKDKLIQYDRIAVNTIVKKQGRGSQLLRSCVSGGSGFIQQGVFKIHPADGKDLPGQGSVGRPYGDRNIGNH